MKKFLAIAAVFAGLVLLPFVASPAFAQNATVVSSCVGLSVPTGYASSPLIMNSTGALCINGGSPTGPDYIAPSQVTPTDKGGTVTLGGTAQTAIAANTARKGWCIQNDPAATEQLNVASGVTATATNGTALSPGQQACNPPAVTSTGNISVYAATTGHRWYGVEVQ